jgi:transposase-like protein
MLKLMPSQLECLTLLEAILWNGKPRCPYCKQRFSTPIHKEQRHHCNHCNTTFSVTTGTIFHRTRIPLTKWFEAICIITGASRAIPVRDLANQLSVNKNTACRISTRIYSASITERKLILEIGGLLSYEKR